MKRGRGWKFERSDAIRRNKLAGQRVSLAVIRLGIVVAVFTGSIAGEVGPPFIMFGEGRLRRCHGMTKSFKDRPYKRVRESSLCLRLYRRDVRACTKPRTFVLFARFSWLREKTERRGPQDFTAF